jgi:hypothetical protein
MYVTTIPYHNNASNSSSYNQTSSQRKNPFRTMSSPEAPPEQAPPKMGASLHSPNSIKKKLGELDGSLHASIHGNKGRVSQHVPILATDEDVNSITEGTDDFGLLEEEDGNDKDGGDDGSFCDADETCSADKGFCRRGMSVGEEELTNFLVEYGNEIKAAAYYGEDGEVIEVPMDLIPPEKQPKEENLKDKDEDEEIIDEEDVEKILAPASLKTDGDVKTEENGAC